LCFCFFFQAEDGIRDLIVTGVQTCALPICVRCAVGSNQQAETRRFVFEVEFARLEGLQPIGFQREDYLVERVSEEFVGRKISGQIGRASCRERVESRGGGGGGKDKMRQWLG